MNIYLKVFCVSLATLVLLRFGKLFYIARSYGNEIFKHYPGECHVVQGLVTKGSEDMTMLPSGKVLITSGLQGFQEDYDYSKNVVEGAIYVMDTNKGFDSVERLDIKGWPAGRNFEPHGVGHWVHENKSVSVFIVLHMPESVGRFLYDGKKTLTLTKIYENEEYMRNINSVELASEDSFYVTNILQARFRDKISANLEFILYGIMASNVIYVNGDDYMVAASGLSFPNGMTGDGKYVYVATKGAVQIFTKKSDGSLQYHKSIPVSIGSLDNIKLDATGDLWIGCQNILQDAVDYIAHPDKLKCHSTVIRVKDPLGTAEVESVFVDDTSLIQASTVAIYTKKKLLIGSVIDTMVVCDVNYLSGR